MFDFGSLEEFGQSAGTAAGNIAPALAAAYLLAPQALQGAFYSAGGETFAAERHFGPVFSKEGAEKAGFARTVRGGETNARFSRDGGLFKSKPAVNFIDDAGDAFTRSTDGGLTKGGLQKLTKLSIGLPVAMTAFGAKPTTNLLGSGPNPLKTKGL